MLSLKASTAHSGKNAHHNKKTSVIIFATSRSTNTSSEEIRHEHWMASAESSAVSVKTT